MQPTSFPSVKEYPGAVRKRLSFSPQRVADYAILVGLALYAMAAPHSIAGAEAGLTLVALGWLLRTLATGKTGLRRTAVDLPLWLFFAWSIASALLSAEPRISLLKLQTVSTFLVFYFAQATLTRARVVALAALLIASGVTGALWSVSEIVRGRGLIVESVAADSPFRETSPAPLEPGECVWRVNKDRVASVAEIDEVIRRLPAGKPLTVSVIAFGENLEWTGPPVTDELKERANPSGLTGAQHAHRFRASGWTRHYEMFAETLQMIAQLALGLALANLQKKGLRRRVALFAAAFVLLAVGIALTAMRTVLIAFAIGATVVVWRATDRQRRSIRLGVLAVIASALIFGALVVARTRASGALLLQDASSSLRWRVARAAIERIPLHPLFGHGMDAVKRHWTEWNFPGTIMIHTHSTPVQIAFDRGLPAVLFWLSLMVAFWLMATRAEKAWRASDDTDGYGFLLGALGALAGFLASSIVNYNFGNSEVALLFWWLMGAVVAVQGDIVNYKKRRD